MDGQMDGHMDGHTAVFIEVAPQLKNDLENKGDLKNEDDHKNVEKVILITVPWPLNEKPLNQPGDLELWLGLAIFCRYGTDLIICISNQSIKYLCEEDS